MSDKAEQQKIAIAMLELLCIEADKLLKITQKIDQDLAASKHETDKLFERLGVGKQ